MAVINRFCCIHFRETESTRKYQREYNTKTLPRKIETIKSNCNLKYLCMLSYADMVAIRDSSLAISSSVLKLSPSPHQHSVSTHHCIPFSYNSNSTPEIQKYRICQISVLFRLYNPRAVYG